MLSDACLIELFAPVAAAILGIDAQAVTRVAARKGEFAGLDRQPSAVAMASERRAIVATELRKVIAPEAGWALIPDHLMCGAYEWLYQGTTIRLSKTNRESRREAAIALLQAQGVLFEMPAQLPATGDEVLIRLNGDAARGWSVDVVSVGPRGQTFTAISLKAIAEAQTDQISYPAPSKTSVALPRRHTAETG